MTTKMMMTASALALGLGLGAAQAQAQDDPIKIGMAAYGLNAEFMQLWSAAGEKHPAATTEHPQKKAAR